MGYTEDKIYSENIIVDVIYNHTDAIKSDYAYLSHNISILEVSNPISRLEVSKPTEEWGNRQGRTGHSGNRAAPGPGPIFY